MSQSTTQTTTFFRSPDLKKAWVWMVLLGLCAIPCLTWAATPQASFSTPPDTRTSDQDRPLLSKAGPMLREELIFAPINWWRQLLERKQPGLLMPYGRWQRHWQRYLRQQVPHSQIKRIPILLPHMSVKGRVKGQQLQLHVKLKVRLLAKGWRHIPLKLKGLGISSFSFKGMTGSLGLACRPPYCRPEMGDFKLSIKGPAEGLLLLHAGVPINKTAQGQKVQFQLPHTPTSHLDITLPGRQEVTSSSGYTRVTLTPKHTHITGSMGIERQFKLHFRPQEAGNQQQVMVATRAQEKLMLQPQWTRRHVRLQLLERMGQRERHTIHIPKGFRLLSVKAPAVRGWLFAKGGDRLSFRFRPGTHTSQKVISLQLLQQGAATKMLWQPLRVEGAYSQTGTLTLRVHQDIKARIKQLKHMRRRALRKPKQAKSDTTSGDIKLPFWKQSSALALTLTPVTPVIQSSLKSRLVLSQRQAAFHIQLKLKAKEGRLHTFAFQVTEGWPLQSLSLATRKTPRYWKQGKLWYVQLPKPLRAGQEAKLSFSFVRQIKLPAKEVFVLKLPTLEPKGLLQRRGSLQVQHSRFYSGTFKGLKGLLEQAVSQRTQGRQTIRRFEQVSPDYTGAIHLKRKRVRLQAMTVARYQMTPRKLEGTLDVYLRIQGASTSTLKLQLTHARGTEIQWRGKGVTLLSQTPTASKGAKDHTRTWRLKMARERFGQVALQLRVTRSRAQKPGGTLPMPMVSLPDAQVEQGFVAVIATPSLQLQASPQGLQSIDPLLLPGPLFRKGAFSSLPVMAYRYQQPTRTLQLRWRQRQPKRLLRALIKQAHMRASLKRDGALHVQATVVLHSKGLQVFKTQLPKGAELWSITRDGKGLKPMKQGRDVRIPLPRHRRLTRYQIQLHYVTKGASLSSMVNARKAAAPTFPYPVQKSRWSLHYPRHYSVFGTHTKAELWGHHQPKALLYTVFKGIKRHPGGAAIVGVILALLLFHTQLLALLGLLLGGVRWLLLQLVGFFQWLFARPLRWISATGVFCVLLFLSFLFLTNGALKESAPMAQKGSANSDMLAFKPSPRKYKRGKKKRRWRWRSTDKKEAPQSSTPTTAKQAAAPPPPPAPVMPQQAPKEDAKPGAARRSIRRRPRPRRYRQSHRKRRIYKPRAKRAYDTRTKSKPKLLLEREKYAHKLADKPTNQPADSDDTSKFPVSGKKNREEVNRLTSVLKDRISQNKWAKNQNQSMGGGKGKDTNQRLKKSGLLGVTQGTVSRGNISRLIQEAQKRQRQKQKMLQWMMRKGESRMMRGIRSLPIRVPRAGAALKMAAPGLLPEMKLTLWNQDALRVFTLLLMACALMLWLLLGWWLPKHALLLFWGGLILSATSGLLLSAQWLLFANAITTGIALSGLFLFTRRRGQPPTTGPSSQSAALLLLVGLGLSSTLLPTNDAIAAKNQATKAAKATKGTNKAPKAAKDANAALKAAKAALQAAKAGNKGAKATQPGSPGRPCDLPFEWDGKGPKGHTAKLFVPYSPKQGWRPITAQTPVLVPYRWWALLRSMSHPDCQRKQAKGWWTQAHYKLRLDTERPSLIRGRATFAIHTQGTQWQRIPLGLRGVRLLGQTIQRKEGAQGKGYIRYRQHTQRGYEVLLKGTGETWVTLDIEWDQAAGTRALKMFLAPAVAASLELTLPGGAWQVSIPNATGGLVHEQYKAQTRVRAFLGASRTLKVKWKPKSEAARPRQELAQAVSYQHLSLRPHMIRLKSRFAFSYQFGKSDRFSFVLPKDTILESIAGQDLRKWYIQKKQDGSQTLIILLNKARQQVRLDLQLVSLRRKESQRGPLPLLKPLFVSQQSGWLGLHISPLIRSTVLGVERLEKRSAQEYTQATTGWGGAVTEAYSYGRTPALTAILSPHKNAPSFQAQLKVAFTGRTKSTRRTKVHAHFKLTDVPPDTFVVPLTLSSSLRLSGVRGSQPNELRQHWYGPIKEGMRTLYVEWNQPINKGAHLIIEAEQPHKMEANLPVLYPQKTKKLEGAILIYIPEDLEAQSDRLEGLRRAEGFEADLDEELTDTLGLAGRPLREARLSFLFNSTYKGKIQLRHKNSSTRCTGRINLRLEERSATISADLTFRAVGAGQRQWSLSLPRAFAHAIEWEQAPEQATRNKQLTKERVKYTWTLLQPSKRQRIRFRIRQPLSKEGLFTLAAIRAEGVAQQEIKLLISKTESIRVHLPKTPGKAFEKLSLASLSARPRSLVAAYQLKESDWFFTTKRESLRTQIAVKPTVDVAHIETTLTTNEQAWTQVTYTLRTPGLQQLPIVLPKGATLWQATIEGQDHRLAKRSDSSYVLPLPPKQTSDLAYTIKLLYAHKVSLPSSYGAIPMQAPALKDIEIAQSFWTVRLPSSYKVAWQRGNMERTPLFQVAAQRFSSAMLFNRKLQKMAAIGSKQQQLRAKVNLIRQTKQLSQSISRINRMYRKALRQTREQGQQGKLRALNEKLREDQQSLQRSQRTIRTVKANGRLDDPFQYWKKQFQLPQGQLLQPLTNPNRQGGAFRLLHRGIPWTYGTVGGTPQLTLTVWQRRSVWRSSGKVLWLAGLALFVILLLRRRSS